MLEKKDVKRFFVNILDGGWNYKVELVDNKEYEIMYRYDTFVTAKGNKSKRKTYFIKKNNKKLVFSDEVKAEFLSYKLPYERYGI